MACLSRPGGMFNRCYPDARGAACRINKLSRWVNISILRAMNKRKKGLRTDKPHTVFVWLEYMSPGKSRDKPIKYAVRVMWRFAS